MPTLSSLKSITRNIPLYNGQNCVTFIRIVNVITKFSRAPLRQFLAYKAASITRLIASEHTTMSSLPLSLRFYYPPLPPLVPPTTLCNPTEHTSMKATTIGKKNRFHPNTNLIWEPPTPKFITRAKKIKKIKKIKKNKKY